MRLFKVTRADPDDFEWQECDTLIVRASGRDRVLHLVLTGNHGCPYLGFHADNMNITEITVDGDEEVIVASHIS